MADRLRGICCALVTQGDPERRVFYVATTCTSCRLLLHRFWQRRFLLNQAAVKTLTSFPADRRRVTSEPCVHRARLRFAATIAVSIDARARVRWLPIIADRAFCQRDAPSAPVPVQAPRHRLYQVPRGVLARESAEFFRASVLQHATRPDGRKAATFRRCVRQVRPLQTRGSLS